MNISAPFIQRPVATSLLTAGDSSGRRDCLPLAACGTVAEVDFPTISGVRRSLPGASPETMASSVATPLERQFGRIAGVTEMTSSSLAGLDIDHSAVRSEPQY